MDKFLVITLLVLFINVGTFITTLACPNCPYPHPPSPPKVKPPPSPPTVKPSPPKVKPPTSPPRIKPPPLPPAVKPRPCPPKVIPPPSPPKVKPPPSPPKVKPPPSPPKVKPPPSPPKVEPPPSPPKVIPPPSPPKVEPPPKVNPPSPAKPKMCPIDTLKLGACVDLLGGLVHIGIGPSAESKCCPLISGLADLDAALCLCTTIKAKLLNIQLILPIALQLLLDCGKHLPSDYQCPA